MSYEDEDVSINYFEKPRKKVRWSDEVEIDDASLHHLYEPERDSINENVSIENEAEAVSAELQSFGHTAESKSKAVDCDHLKAAANSLPEFCDEKTELIVCNKQDSSEVDSSVQSGEKAVVSDPTPMEHFDNNNSLMADLESIIYETELMSISSSKQAEKVSSNEQVEACLPPDSNAENVLHVVLHQIKQDELPASSTRKRSLDGELIARPSTSFCQVPSICLKTNISPSSSGAEMTSPAFNPWSNIQSDTATVESTPSVPEIKVVLPNPSQENFVNETDAVLTGSKRKKDIVYRGVRKVKVLDFDSESDPEPSSEPQPEPDAEQEPEPASEPQPEPDAEQEPKSESQERKSDSEEGKMAFRAWKKKKDELLNQQIAEKHKKEEKKRLDTLMNERVRKSDAESAYLAWLLMEVMNDLMRISIVVPETCTYDPSLAVEHWQLIAKGFPIKLLSSEKKKRKSKCQRTLRSVG